MATGFDAVEEALGRPLTAPVMKRLSGTPEWEALSDGYPDPKFAAQECANLVDSWALLKETAKETAKKVPTGAMPDGEVARMHAKALLCWSDANEDVEVQSWRSRHLSDGFVALEEVGEWVRSRAGKGKPDRLLAFPDGGHVGRVTTREGTALDDLRDLSQVLALRYGLTEDTATAFVLCDAVPVPKWVRVTDRDAGPLGRRIILDVDPGTPAEVVAQIYGERRAELGLAHRPPAPSTFEMFAEWVSLDRPSLERLPLRRWEQEHGRTYNARSARRAIVRCWEYFTGEQFTRS